MDLMLDNIESIIWSKEITTNDLKGFADLPPKPQKFLSTRLEQLSINQIRYISNGKKIAGYLVYPRNTRDKKLPVIIFNRGGNRDFGALNNAMATKFLGGLAAMGYVVIASQYSGGPGSEGRDQFGGDDLNDVLVLKTVIDELPLTDPDKIGMYGWSRGGLMTYLALKSVDWIKAVVIGGASSDLNQMTKERPKFGNMLEELIGNNPTEYEKRSPIKWVAELPKDIPILLLHGDADERVNVSHTKNMIIELEKNNVNFEAKMFEGGDHGLTTHMQEKNQLVEEWFHKYL